jgi:membrane protease YdiL (CAAX protease family)
MIDILLLILVFVSLGVWGVVARRLWSGRPVLEREPRNAVPWNWWFAMPAVLLTLLAVASSLSTLTEVPAANLAQAAESVDDGSTDGVASGADVDLRTAGAGILFMVVMLVGLVVVLTNACYTTTHDLGFPESNSQLASDIRLGLWTAVAALLPVYLVQLAASLVFGNPSHPLVDQMVANPNWAMFALAGLSAVVLAPLFEEIVFRLLLQGALEKWEDAQAGLVAATHNQSPDHLLTDDTPRIDELEAHVAGGESIEHSGTRNPYESPQSASDVPPTELVDVAAAHPLHGWKSITVSSILFAAAHAGHGSSPAGLLVLAAMFGYVYQRTHRIVPTMVAHAAFNCLSIALVILAIVAGEPID